MNLEINKPKIREHFWPRLENDNTIKFGFLYPLEHELKNERYKEIWEVLQLLDGTRTVSQVAEQLKNTIPDSEELTTNIVGILKSVGIIVDAEVKPPSEFNEVELERYSRNARYFSWVDLKSTGSGYDSQLKLKNSAVTVVGLGGIGASIAWSLVAIGVGAVHLVDFDIVELSNLSRQILYSEIDLNRSKAQVAYEKLRELNSQVKVTYEEKKASSVSDFVAWMEKSDILILAADTPFEINYWCNDAAFITKTPWIQAGYDGPKIISRSFIPYETACFECLQNREEHLAIKPEPPSTQRWHSAIAPLTLLSAQIASLEIIYFLIGLSNHTMGRAFVQNGLSYDIARFEDLPRLSDCPKCNSR